MSTQRYHHTSSVIGALINPSNGIRDEQKRRGLVPKDHMRENARNIAQIERAKQQEEHERIAKETAQPFRLREFDDAKPRVMDAVEAAKQAQTREFLKAGEGTAGGPHLAPRNDSVKPYQPRPKLQPTVPKFDKEADSQFAATMEAQRRQVNKIRENMKTIKTQSALVHQEREKKQDEKGSDMHRTGEVPEYLRKRKEQWSVEEAQRREDAAYERFKAKIPPGTRPVGTEERKALLAELRTSLQTEIVRLNSFRVSNDSMAAAKSRDECERKIEQLEKTIAEFEKPGDLYIAL